jgi:hypothetical protein
MNSEKRKVGEKWSGYQCTLYVHGIAPRCRKEDLHSVPLGIFREGKAGFLNEQEKIDMKSELLEKSKDSIAKFKNIRKTTISCDFVEFEKTERGEFMTWQAFGSKNFSFNVD